MLGYVSTYIAVHSTCCANLKNVLLFWARTVCRIHQHLLFNVQVTILLSPFSLSLSSGPQDPSVQGIGILSYQVREQVQASACKPAREAMKMWQQPKAYRRCFTDSYCYIHIRAAHEIQERTARRWREGRHHASKY